MKRTLLTSKGWSIQEKESFDKLECVICWKTEEMMHINGIGQSLCGEHKDERVVIMENK